MWNYHWPNLEHKWQVEVRETSETYQPNTVWRIYRDSNLNKLKKKRLVCQLGISEC